MVFRRRGGRRSRRRRICSTTSPGPVDRVEVMEWVVTAEVTDSWWGEGPKWMDLDLGSPLQGVTYSSRGPGLSSVDMMDLDLGVSSLRGGTYCLRSPSPSSSLDSMDLDLGSSFQRGMCGWRSPSPASSLDSMDLDLGGNASPGGMSSAWDPSPGSGPDLMDLDLGAYTPKGDTSCRGRAGLCTSSEPMDPSPSSDMLLQSTGLSVSQNQNQSLRQNKMEICPPESTSRCHRQATTSPSPGATGSSDTSSSRMQMTTTTRLGAVPPVPPGPPVLHVGPMDVDPAKAPDPASRSSQRAQGPQLPGRRSMTGAPSTATGAASRCAASSGGTTARGVPGEGTSRGGGDVCADVMDMVDDDVEMGGFREVAADVEMALDEEVTGGDDLVLGD